MNGSDHAAFNVVLGAGNGALKCFLDADREGREVSVGELLVHMAASGVGCWATSSTPDLIDPPDHPSHRDVGHAVLPVGAACCAAYRAAARIEDPVVRRFVEGLSLGPLGHLAADAMTPKGINFLRRGL